MVEANELEQLAEEIKRAAIRCQTLDVVIKSGKRERDALRNARKDADGKLTGKPTRLESATIKGLWGMDEWLRVAESEYRALMVKYTQLVTEEASVRAVDEYRARIKERKARVNGTVVLEVGKPEPAGRKKKMNRKL